MPMLNCYVDDRTYEALLRCKALHGRSLEDLAEAAIADAAIRNDPLPPDRPRKAQLPRDGGEHG